MPKVVRFSVFFPSLSSSSAVWAQTKAHQEHSNAASVFFMISPFERAIVSLPHEGEDARRRGARSLWGTVREPNGAGSTLRSGLALLVAWVRYVSGRNVMSFGAPGAHSRIRALGICLVSLALPLFLGSCKGGASGSSSSSAQIPDQRRGRLVGFPVHIRRRAEALFHVFEIRLRAVGHQRGGTATGAFRARQAGSPPQHKPVR